jgi:energy-coupling factor transporter ATP-binding protein EcfA2
MHLYCIGKSGSGKSTLLQNMAIDDIEKNNGLCVVDPHGDLSESLLDYIPHDRIDDVIYFNPADTEFPIAFNPLRNVHPEFYELTVSGLLSMFQNIWSDHWGPRLAHILRFSLLTLIEYRKASLLDIQPLLTDPAYRATVLTYVTNEKLRSFWFNEFDQYTKAFRAEAIAPILNKVGIFSTSSVLKNIVGQDEKGLDFKEIMDGKILLVNLAKGKLGEDVCALLGSMIVASIQLSALHRARQPEHTRRNFFLYVDECASFTSLSFAGILAEARKYGLSVFLCHQYIDQLRPEIRSAIMGNVGTMISFRIGGPDAEYLAKEFYPTFNQYDLINLPRYTMYLKLMIDGATSSPFSAYSLPLKEKVTSFKREAIAASREKYSTSIKQVNVTTNKVKDVSAQPSLF